MHFWGDKDVDWRGIDDAASFVGNFCLRWGRLGGGAKEKFGTVRFYASFQELSLHSLIHPRHAYCQFPKWLWRFDLAVVAKLLSPFNKPFRRWQEKVYRRAYQLAVRKWPHLQKEILSAADWPEFLEGLENEV